MELVAKGIHHGFGGLSVLEDVDLAVRGGEVLSVIGPSGCGKSTLLYILGGLLRPTAGGVTIAGSPPPECLNPISYVFQDAALLPWLSAADNIGFALDPHRLPARERTERIRAVLETTHLTDFAGALPKQLSGGMRQRVGIARALATRPAIMLMDEPLSALDAQTRELLMEEFAGVWRASSTGTVYVTHNLAEAVRLADRVMVLSRRPGRVREIVPVPIADSDRTNPAGRAEMARIQDRLWELIRDEAASADREIAA